MKRICLALAAIALICFGSAALIMRSSGTSFIDIFRNNGFSISSNSGSYKYTLSDEVTEKLDGIDTLDLSFVSGDVTFHEGDDNNVKAVLSGNISSSKSITAPKLKTSKNGSKLQISLAPYNFTGSFMHLSFNTKVDIYLPKSYNKDLNVSTVSADININDRNQNNLTIGTTSGEILGSKITCNEVTLKSVSGDIKVSDIVSNTGKASSTSGEINLKNFEGSLDGSTVSGDLDIEYKNFSKDLDFRTTSGEITISLPSDSSFNFDAKSVSGDIRCKYPLSDETKSKRGLSGNYKNGTNKISLNTVSGDINLK